jgi:cytochrome c biogenesis protein CcdA/thiol-disulfide isomerase/thioredoxin
VALLIIFGFVAGAATAVSPCVLPVLPIALSAGANGGRRRPLGIVAGLVVSFTFAIVALVYVIDALGLPGDLLRKIAICVLLGFGLLLLVPPLAARVEAFGSRFAGRVPTPRGGDGFWSGTVVGASLGLVYAPCAGPILAGVITVTASQSFDAGRLAVALAYGLGSAAVLYALMVGGRRAIRPLARRGGAFQVATGAVMVVVALAMLGNYDTRFESAIASDWPSWLTTPAEGLESTGSAKSALASISGFSAHGLGARATAGSEEEEVTRTPPSKLAAEKMKLPVYGKAPEFTDTERWFNTPGGRPLTLRQLRGKVVLVDFWTYSCVNCIRTLPYLNAWYRRYHRDGFVIVGVHTPEFPFEREAGNVEAAIKREGIHYPVVQDNEAGTWSAYGNLYWPSEYFLDANGEVRFADAGEGEYGKKEAVIRQLLAESGKRVGRARADAHGIEPSDAQLTPETYLGPYRAERNANGGLGEGLSSFTQPASLGESEWSLGGRWQVDHESITASAGSTLRLDFQARRVYLVLGSRGGPRRMQVLLDGKPIAAVDAGEDVHGGEVTVGAHRLYNLVDLPEVEHHVLELRPEAGIIGYAFTFG